MSSMHYHSYQYQPSSDQSYPPSPSDSSYSSSSGDPLFVSNVLPSYNHASTSAEPYHPPPPYSSNEEFVSLQNKPRSRTTTRINVYPYARINAKKEEVKRRRIWNHALEKSLFSPYELCVVSVHLGVVQRLTQQQVDDWRAAAEVHLYCQSRSTH